MATATSNIIPREITDDEAAFFKENGWVLFHQLISSDDAGVLLSRLQEIMGTDAAGAAHPTAPDNPQTAIPYFHTWEPLAVDIATGSSVDDLFYTISHAPSLGRLGSKLSGGPVRYWIDGALVKMPATDQTGAGPTNWHADVGAVETSPFDPPQGQMQLWVALRDMTPEHGTMRFVSPQNATDEVVAILREHATDPEASYPLLEEMGVISEPLSMRAGDATIHASATWHSAPINRSAAPRWNYMCSLFPAGARYSGVSHFAMEKVAGMEPGDAFPDVRFPVLA
jgi:hypothetical protein